MNTPRYLLHTVFVCIRNFRYFDNISDGVQDFPLIPDIYIRKIFPSRENSSGDVQ